MKGSDVFHMKRLLHERPRVRLCFRQIFFWLKIRFWLDFLVLLLLYISEKGKTSNFEISERKWFNVINISPTNQNYSRNIMIKLNISKLKKKRRGGRGLVMKPI